MAEPSKAVRGALGRAKRATRHVVERVARPYVEEIVGRVSHPPAPAGWWDEPFPPVFVQLHATLHEARTLALADMPPGARTMLSPGANGSWYFDWIEGTYGSVERHIAVEAFMPRPEELPDYVEWLEADIAALGGVGDVADSSIDLVYSGQNVEHLWPEQMVAFFTETNRILHDGGWLVVDSPNREVTAELSWSMAEHTIEFAPDEVGRLFELAGFELTTLKGVWLCREHGQLLPLDPLQDAGGAGSVLRRMVLANGRPEDSFIWWAEGRRCADPDVAGLRARIHDVFDAHWAERVSRLQVFGDRPRVHAPDGTTSVIAERGNAGDVLIGPWMALPAGTFAFEMDVSWRNRSGGGETVGTLEMRVGDDVLDETAIKADADSGSTRLRVQAELPGTRFGVHVLLRSLGNAELEVPLTLSLSPDPWRAGDGNGRAS
jgi:SAM-dependent methyltransferase